MDHVVFDAEPLIAYYWDEPGSDAVEAIINRKENTRVFRRGMNPTLFSTPPTIARPDIQRLSLVFIATFS